MSNVDRGQEKYTMILNCGFSGGSSLLTLPRMHLEFAKPIFLCVKSIQIVNFLILAYMPIVREEVLINKKAKELMAVIIILLKFIMGAFLLFKNLEFKR